jgi:hypothetical protein
MDYYKETPPLEFIGDVYDIMKDGDGLAPEKLVVDVVDMLGKYLSAQHSIHPTAYGVFLKGVLVGIISAFIIVALAFGVG